jgi:hypothetical protein
VNGHCTGQEDVACWQPVISTLTISDTTDKVTTLVLFVALFAVFQSKQLMT